MTKNLSVTEACQEIQDLYLVFRRYENSASKTRNVMYACVASSLGYRPSLDDNDRERAYAVALDLIERVGKGEQLSTDERKLKGMIEVQLGSVTSFNDMADDCISKIVSLFEFLPSQVIEWMQHPDQNGFADKLLARIIGETGDLANYAAPGKLWKRMGCAPHEKNGEVHACSTWRKRSTSKENGVVKLTAREWEAGNGGPGYCPRRRAVVHVVADTLLKSNYVRRRRPDKTMEIMATGPYRQRYDHARVTSLSNPSHASWPKQWHHLHSLLLAGKLLLKNLWIVWNPDMAR